MKVWLISSDPFLNDFEKIVDCWDTDREVVITTISKFSLNQNDFLKFLFLFLKINPNVILTDHGYFGFFFIRFFSRLAAKPVKISFFLRGNYWLERRLLSEKKVTDRAVRSRNFKPVKKTATMKIITDNLSEMTVIDPSTNIVITPTSKILSKNKKGYVFENLWLGDFTLKYNGKKLPINTRKIGTTEDNGLKININHHIKLSRLVVFSKKISKLRRKYEEKLSKFGWEYTIRKANEVIVVCEYLKKIVIEETGRKDAIICPIGIKTELPKVKNVNLKHPAICMIQNHQIKKKSEALVQFSKVIEKIPEVHFYISKGLPENRNNINYKKVINTLEKLKNVDFVEINSKNKFDYLTSCDLYILATGLDCTPATILEASLAGKPVLASKIGGVPEMIKDGITGWSIENNDEKTWIEKINLLTKNKSLAKKMGASAKKHVIDNYNTPLVAKRLFNIIKDKNYESNS